PLLIMLLLFFFHAEDGIRDRNVTGVQTCALPISPVLYTATAVNRTGPDGESLTDSGWRVTVQSPGSPPAAPTAAAGTAGADAPRSEERRVGKESRTRRAA